MRRDEAIAVLASVRGDAISLPTMQSIGPWRAAKQANQRNLDVIGCMGSAGAIGLGIALAQPATPVFVLDGDGSLLMQLGTLATIAEHAPRNLYHFVFENGTYQTSGNQPVPAHGRLDFAATARACGYFWSASYEDADVLRRELPDALSRPGPALVEVQIDREDYRPLGRIPRAPDTTFADGIAALRRTISGGVR